MVTAGCPRFFIVGQAMSRNSRGHGDVSSRWKRPVGHFGIRKPMALAIARICTMTPVRRFTGRLRISWRLGILRRPGPRSFTGWRSPGAESASRASIRAALHGASARVGMFASRFPSSQSSKNASFPTVEKRLVLHYTSVADFPVNLA